MRGAGIVGAMIDSRAEQAVAGSLVAFAAFQLALASGAPWGRAAYGGTRSGTLPTHLRAVSGGSAIAYATGAALVLAGSGTDRSRGRAFTAISVLMGVGSLANGASRSPLERAIWTPVTVATSVLAWRARDRRS